MGWFSSVNAVTPWREAGESALAAAKMPAGPDRDRFLDEIAHLDGLMYRAKNYPLAGDVAERMRDVSPEAWALLLYNFKVGAAGTFWIRVAVEAGAISKERIMRLDGTTNLRIRD